MKKLIFIAIFIASTLFSNALFGQVTAVGCTIDPAKYNSAIGYQTQASGMYSLASGYLAYANTDNSFVFGTGINHGGGKIYELLSPCSNSFLVGFNANPVFFAKLDPARGHQVGIGTVTPNSALDVKGTTRTEKLRVVNQSIQYTGQKLGFYSIFEGEGGLITDPVTPTLSLKENCVGIMTNNPTTTLDVNGNMQADTVKIKRSIFLPEDELTFTYYSEDGNLHDTSIIIIEPCTGKGGGINTLMTLKHIKDIGVYLYKGGNK